MGAGGGVVEREEAFGFGSAGIEGEEVRHGGVLVLGSVEVCELRVRSCERRGVSYELWVILMVRGLGALRRWEPW